MQKDEILVFGYDASIDFARFLPNLAVEFSLKAKIPDMVRLMSFADQPLRERRRQIGIDEKLHGAAAIIG